MKTINKIYHAAIYVRLSKEDGDVSNTAKTESNSISNQKSLVNSTNTVNSSKRPTIISSDISHFANG